MYPDSYESISSLFVCLLQGYCIAYHINCNIFWTGVGSDLCHFLEGVVTDGLAFVPIQDALMLLCGSHLFSLQSCRIYAPSEGGTSWNCGRLHSRGNKSSSQNLCLAENYSSTSSSLNLKCQLSHASSHFFRPDLSFKMWIINICLSFQGCSSCQRPV